jgi:hypothetical protein
MHHLTLALLLAVSSCAPAFAQDAAPPPDVEVVGDAPTTDADAGAGDEPAPAPAPEVDLDDTVDQIVDAASSKDWILLAGLALTLLVHLANKIGLKNKVGATAVPWVTAGTGVLAAIGTGLVSGVPVATVIMDGLLVGVTAIGGWEMLFKHILGRVPTDPAPAAASE